MLPDALGPSEGDLPINAPVSVQLGPLEQANVTFTPEQQVTDFRVLSLLISKEPNTGYRIRMDDSVEFGEAPVPPSDVDDSGPTFLPPKQFSNEMEVRVRNLSENKTRVYHIQPIGWEEV